MIKSSRVPVQAEPHSLGDRRWWPQAGSTHCRYLHAPLIVEEAHVREALRGWGWFIPHRLDLWPAPVKPETVQQKFPFSPQWIAEVLRQHEIKLEENGSN